MHILLLSLHSMAHVQQSVACNALHVLEARLCRWLLQAQDCIDGDAIPLTQDFLGQMLGVRRTTVTIAARLLQSALEVIMTESPAHLRKVEDATTGLALIVPAA